MEKIKKQKAFTLVELIIVITILAVLATIAFLSFQSYTKNGRDSVRLVNLSDISKALQTQKTTTGKYPTPDDIYGTGNILGVNLFHVGKVGNTGATLLRFQSVPLDPLTKQPYPYGLSLDNKHYQVAAAFENLQAQNTLVSQTNAQTYKAKVEGNYKGLLKFSSGSNQYIGNVPSLIFSRTGEYELISQEPYFIVNNGTNLPYSFDGSSFSGTQTKEQILQEVTGEPVTLTGIVVGDWETNKDNLISSLGYPGDIVGVEVLGNAYYALPTGQSLSTPSLSCSILHDSNNGTTNGNFMYQNEFNGKIYFAGSGETLWSSDGNIIGTQQVHMVKPKSFMMQFKGELYFPGNTTASGTELWKTDGTTAGTVIVKDMASGSSSSTPYMMGKDANYLYFSIFNTTSPQLWRTDGTIAGTIRIGTFTWGLSQLFPYNGITYFTVEGSGLGKELWKTDGTLAGTVIVRDITPGTNTTGPMGFVGYNGKLYFFANNGTNGTELWSSNGTSGGTSMVKDINVGTGSANTSGDSPIEFNGQIYFAAQSGSGMELWKSDGTSTGTVMVKDINPGAGGSNPSSLTIYKNELYFVASSIGDDYNVEIWKTDGTSTGTVKISDADVFSYTGKNFHLHNGDLYFLERDGSKGELWKTDGVTTQRIKDINTTGDDDVKTIHSMNGSVNGKFFFYVNHPDYGRELWFTDGTEAGTQISMDINPGVQGIGDYGGLFISLGNKVIFLAKTADKGDEVWKCE